MITSLPVQLLNSDAVLPRISREGDAGYDLCSTIDLELKPFERTLIPTGIAVAIPQGYAGFVLPRSGMAIKQGFSLVNAPGLIDSNYRGEIKVIAINLDPTTTIAIKRGDRIAQLTIQAVATPQLEVYDSLDETNRGDAGFGSSGV